MLLSQKRSEVIEAVSDLNVNMNNIVAVNNSDLRRSYFIEVE